MIRPSLSPLAFTVLLSALCAFAVLFFPALACTTSSGGDGDDSSASSGQADDDTGDDDDCAACETTGECTDALGEGWVCEGGCCEDVGGGDDDDDDDEDNSDNYATKISGVVLDWQTRTDVASLWIEAVDNTTGLSFDPPAGTQSNQDGEFVFGVPDVATFGLRVYAGGLNPDAMPTYKFGYVAGDDLTVFAIRRATAELIHLSLGMALDDSRGSILGRVLFVTDTDEEPVGCAEVEVSGTESAGVFYFGPDALPTLARNITGESPENGQGTNPGYDSNSEPISVFFGGAVVPGLATVKASVERNEEIASEWSLPRPVFAHSFLLQDILFDESKWIENPTPGWCTQ